jgi:iduronate 2-sulfatase
MNRLNRLKRLILTGIAGLGFVFGAIAADRPNVLMIVVDDLNATLGCYGHPDAITPNIDRLAGRGRRFRRAYCQQAVCNPSRASAMTGLRPDTLKVWNLKTHFRDTLPDVVTLPQHFKNHGYFTQGIGKIFHNGNTKPQGDPRSWSVPQTYHWAPHWRDWVVPGAPPGTEPKRKGAPIQQLDVEDEAYWDGQIAAEAKQALGKLAKSKEPFFLAVGFWKPHLPFNAPKKYWDLYDRDLVSLAPNLKPPRDVPDIALHDWRELRNYAGMPKTGKLPYPQMRELRHGYLAAVSYVDAQIGKTLNELDRLGLRDKTVVALWSDHGFHLGEHSLWCKTSTFDLDARVPLIISAPGMKNPGKATDSLTELIDLYPTLAEVCGLPAVAGLEGVSLKPVLDDPKATLSRAALTQHPRPAYYKGEPETMGYSLRMDAFRYTEWRDFRTGKPVAREFYDHGLDALENVNVADKPQYEAAQLKAAALLKEVLSKSKSEVNAGLARAKARAAAAGRKARPGRKPNIVFVLADDLSWSDPGCYGNPLHDTPNLDRLAAQGMRFTDGYSPAPICSASRAALLTGRSPARLNFEFVTKDRPGRQPGNHRMKTPPYTMNLPLEEVTFAERLKEAGYVTGFSGKWHLNQHHQRYLGWSPTHGPKAQGFDHAIETFGSHPYGYQPKNPGIDPAIKPGEFPRDSVTDNAIAFMRQNREQPFLLYLCHYYVHTPVKTLSQWLLDKYEARIPKDSKQRKNRVRYGAFVETLDHHVGQIMGAIDELGLAEETLFVFTADNGGHPEYAANGPLRGSKWNLYEGGIRVPFIVRWPGRTKAGEVTDEPVIGTDLFPTFLEVAGARRDEQREIDGVSLASFLRGGEMPERTQPMVWHFPYYHPEKKFGEQLRKIGVNDFAVSQTFPQSAIRVGKYKLMRFYEARAEEFYNLRERIDELESAEDDGMKMGAPELYERVGYERSRGKMRFELNRRLTAYLDSVGARTPEFHASVISPKPEPGKERLVARILGRDVYESDRIEEHHAQIFEAYAREHGLVVNDAETARFWKFMNQGNKPGDEPSGEPLTEESRMLWRKVLTFWKVERELFRKYGGYVSPGGGPCNFMPSFPESGDLLIQELRDKGLYEEFEPEAKPSYFMERRVQDPNGIWALKNAAEYFAEPLPWNTEEFKSGK